MYQGQDNTSFPQHQGHPLRLQLSSPRAAQAAPVERPLEDEDLGLDLLDDFALDYLSDWDALISPAHATHAAPQPGPGAAPAPGPALTAACEQHVEELLALDPCIMPPAFFEGLDALFGSDTQQVHPQHATQCAHTHANVNQQAGASVALGVSANHGPVAPPPAPRPSAMPYLPPSSPLSFDPTGFFSDDEDCDTTTTTTTTTTSTSANTAIKGQGRGAGDECSLDTRMSASSSSAPSEEPEAAFSSSCTLASADTLPLHLQQGRQAARPAATSRRSRSRRSQALASVAEASYTTGGAGSGTRGKRRVQRHKANSSSNSSSSSHSSSSRRPRAGDRCKREHERSHRVASDPSSLQGMCYSPAPFPAPCPQPLDVLHGTKVALPLVVRVLVVGRQFGNTHTRQTVQALQQATRPLRSLLCFVFDVVCEPMGALEALYRSDVHMVLLSSPTPTLTPEHQRMAKLFARLRPHTYLLHLCPHPSTEPPLPPLHASLCSASLTHASLCAALAAGLPHVWPRFAAPLPTPPVPIPGPLAAEPSALRRTRGPLLPRNKLMSLAYLPPQWAASSKAAQHCQPYNFFAHAQDGGAPPQTQQLAMHQRALAALRAMPGFRPIAPLPPSESASSLEAAKGTTASAFGQPMAMAMHEVPQRLVSGHTVTPVTTPAPGWPQMSAMCL